MHLKIGEPSCVVHSRSDNELQGKRIRSAGSEKKALGLCPQIGQTVQKSGHIVCKDDSVPRSSDLVGTVAVNTDASTYPWTSRPRCSSAPRSH